MANSYFVEDKDLEELAKKVVSEIYNNKDIVNLTNNGKSLAGHLKSLTERNISGIYSNIKNNRSLQSILINAIDTTHHNHIYLGTEPMPVQKKIL